MRSPGGLRLLRTQKEHPFKGGVKSKGEVVIRQENELNFGFVIMKITQEGCMKSKVGILKGKYEIKKQNLDQKLV